MTVRTVICPSGPARSRTEVPAATYQVLTVVETVLRPKESEREGIEPSTGDHVRSHFRPTHFNHTS